MVSRWYVLRFEPGLATLVKRMVSFYGFTLRHFTYEQTRPRQKPLEKAWLPGYLFVRFHPEDNWQVLHDLPGVIGLLGPSQSYPVSISDADMMRLETELPFRPMKNLPANSKYKVGDSLRVSAGPFASFSGPVVWIDGNQLKIEINIFGRGTTVALSTADVDSAE